MEKSPSSLLHAELEQQKRTLEDSAAKWHHIGAIVCPFLDNRLFAIIIFSPHKIANKIAKHKNTCDISFTPVLWNTVWRGHKTFSEMA